VGQGMSAHIIGRRKESSRVNRSILWCSMKKNVVVARQPSGRQRRVTRVQVSDNLSETLWLKGSSRAHCPAPVSPKYQH
jgi:hypothetical protein